MSVTDFGSRVNHVKRLTSFSLSNFYLLISIWKGVAIRQPFPLFGWASYLQYYLLCDYSTEYLFGCYIISFSCLPLYHLLLFCCNQFSVSFSEIFLKRERKPVTTDVREIIQSMEGGTQNHPSSATLLVRIDSQYSCSEKDIVWRLIYISLLLDTRKTDIPSLKFCLLIDVWRFIHN